MKRIMRAACVFAAVFLSWTARGSVMLEVCGESCERWRERIYACETLPGTDDPEICGEIEAIKRSLRGLSDADYGG